MTTCLNTSHHFTPTFDGVGKGMKGKPTAIGAMGMIALKQAVLAIAAFDLQVLSAKSLRQSPPLISKQMHPEEIKAAMRIAGTTPAMLCDELQVAASSVSQTISGHIKSKRIQTRIAEIIGKPIDFIWPNQLVLRRTRAQIDSQRQTIAAGQQRGTAGNSAPKPRTPRRKPSAPAVADEGRAA